ncbi:response regulator [Thalassotalea sp. PLHSN55]|uniref:response regulator n=1 Tax=Thalassotalea sp. PLHSN55 TaxID=3435888 RepID=UPI003F844409
MHNQFQVGGSLTSDSTVYVKRSADLEITTALKNNELCYVFNTRQIGKSSLLLKTKKLMQSSGYKCSYIDISRIGSINITSEQWYAGLAFELWRNFSLPSGMAFFEWWKSLGDIPPPQKLSLFWEEKLLEAFPEDSFILFFDEVDSVISLPFAADDFFTAIRSAYNTEKNENIGRINFAIFGVALPSDLMSDSSRAPFNIGKAIALDCFTIGEAVPLISPFCLPTSQQKTILKRALYWTGGQPFLTQKLLSMALTQLKNDQLNLINEEVIDLLVHDYIIDNWRNNDTPEHLKTIYDRVTLDKNNVQLLSDYLKVCHSDPLPAHLDNYQRLYLTGLVHIKNKTVVVKNQIYKTIFSSQWAEDELSKLRPYHNKMHQWILVQSDKHLLNEKELADAKLWASTRSLSEQDYQYLASSQEKQNKDVKLKNEQLNTEIRQRRLTEEKLQKTLAELDVAKLQAENANKAKSLFLAKVSHEIRTHVNSIIGINYLARKQPEHAEHLKSIDRAANYMHTVINDMVDINQIERGELTFQQEAFYIDSIIDNLININAPMIFNKGLNFLVDIPDIITPPLLSDPRRIEQVLSNLLANAIKYCSIGTISIKIKEVLADSTENQKCYQFSVSDTGQGVSKKCVSGVINNSSHSSLEMGIGLTICYELLNMMGSELIVESIYGQGSTFSFTLTFDIVTETSDGIKKLPIVGIPSTLMPEIVKSLHTINCTVFQYDINDDTFEDHNIDIFLLDEDYLQYQQQLLTLSNTRKIELIPLLTIGNAYPHWLTTLNYNNRIDLPITPRKIYRELISFRQAPTSNTFKLPEIEQANNYHILVAEDDEINQEIMRSLLTLMGINVTIANNGLEATKAITRSKFDLILMDIEMPLMDGIEAVQVIRSYDSSNSNIKNIPIIAMTAHALLGDKQKFIRKGMNDHLSKPIEPQQLTNVLRQWLPKITVKEVNPSEVTFPKIANINISEGLIRCNHNHALYQKVLLQFAKKYSVVEKFDLYNNDQLRLHLHAIKGTAGNIGANEISLLAATLESKCLNDNKISNDELLHFTQNLTVLCSNIEQSMQAMHPEQANTRSALIDANISIDLALKLRQALATDHSQALDICVKMEDSSDKEIINICKAVNAFEIDKAETLLADWLSSHTNIK